MSLKTLPVLFLNLGGEMMYILDQRLRAQNIPDEKAKKGKCCWCQRLLQLAQNYSIEKTSFHKK